MLPSQLTAESFSAYPALGKQVAVARLPLLRGLPISFLPLLLRELSLYDFKFPAERGEIDWQLQYLARLSPTERANAMLPFSRLTVPASLADTNWVSEPAVFSEQLSAHLWKTHQIEAFRKGATDYVGAYTDARPAEKLLTHRLGVVILGQGVRENRYRLFRKLRPMGTYFSQVKHSNGVNTLVEAVAERAKKHPAAFAHWYLDGGTPASVSADVAQVSWAGLASARAALQSRMQKSYEAGVFDPEMFRTRMAQTSPGEVGLDAASEALMNRFRLSLLTEGSGTQVFATTFVQWAAREALRRAQPLTLLARFAPRQRENPMNELLSEATRRPQMDPEGSLIDADMGAYYTWLNQQRLAGAEAARFLVWFEDHAEAVAIGPGFEKNRESPDSMELRELIGRLV